MTTIQPIAADDIERVKDIRLRALRDAPAAFGSTYERERMLTPDEWRDRAARWDGRSGIGFLATEEGAAVAIAGAFLDPDDAKSAQLVSMWTAPHSRRRGVGRLLVGEVVAWARRRGAQVVRLMVTSNNESAIAFYRSLGFELTGRTEPYPNDPALVEYEMSLTL